MKTTGKQLTYPALQIKEALPGRGKLILPAAHKCGAKEAESPALREYRVSRERNRTHGARVLLLAVKACVGDERRGEEIQ